MNEEPMTPLQESVARTGRRFFRASEAVYAALCAEVDARRGFPAGTGSDAVTLRSFPDAADALRADNDDVLASVEVWRFELEDVEMISTAIAAEQVVEMTDGEFEVARPVGE